MVAKGVGAVGVPVNDGDAIVALSNMSAVFAAIALVLLVILAVLAAISVVLIVMLAVFAAMALVLLVILAVFALMAVVLLVMLAVFAAIALVLLVILAVFEAINVGKVVIVVELTPPTLFTVGNAAVPPKSFVSCIIPFEPDVASLADIVPDAIVIPSPAVKAPCFAFNASYSALLNNPAVVPVTDADGIFNVIVGVVVPFATVDV